MNQLEKEVKGVQRQMGLLKKMNWVLLVYAALITLLLVIHLITSLVILHLY